MVCAIRNFTHRGDICNIEDRSAAEPQPKNGRRKGKFNHEARESKKNLTAKSAKDAKDVGAGFKPACFLRGENVFRQVPYP